MNAAMLNLARWIPCTEVEGPGKRFALWVQGCHIRCAGCCNQEYIPLAPRHIIDPAALLRHIEEAYREHGIEGITLLGGEPLLQARGLLPVAQSVRALGLTVMLFTGFVLGKKQVDLPDGATLLLEHCDVVVDGPYVAGKSDDKRNWVGSSNQRFHYLSTAYDSAIESDERYRNGIEIRITPSGVLNVNGFPYLN
jgi:anaerobic ribonucleoside-triphosphate reductase activating protein